VGAGVLSGGAAIPALVAGTAATLPFELGGQLQRQDADPVAAGLSPTERLTAALPGAVGSAALQNVVPAGVAMRLTGKGGAATAKQIVGRAAADIPANAVAEGGAELVRQGADNLANPNAGFSLDAAGDAAIEGAAGGALFGGVGAAGQAAHSLGGTPSRLVGKAKETVQGADLGSFVGSARGKAADAAGKAQEAAQGVDLGVAKDSVAAAADKAVEGLSALADKGRAAVGRVAGGEEFFDPSSFAGKTEGALRSAVAEDGVLRNNAVTQWAKELPEQYLTPEVRAAASDLTDKANQAIVAKARSAWQTAENVGARIDGFVRSFGETKPEGGAKQTADYTGVNKAIVDSLQPYVAKNLPELADRRGTERLAAPLRGVLGEMVAGKPLSIDRLMALIDVTGGHTATIMDRVRQAMNVTDPVELKNFYASASTLLEAQDAHTNLLKTMDESVVDGAGSVDQRTLQDVASGIVRWASTAVKDQTSDAARFYEKRVRQELQRYFGDKVDKVLEAAEKLLPKVEENALEKARTKPPLESDTVRSEDGEQLSDAIPDTKLNTLASGKDGAGYLNPSDDPGKSGFRPAATSAVEKAQATAPGARFALFGDELPLDHPAAQQRFKQLVAAGDAAGVDGAAYAAQEIGKYGAVVRETSNNPLSVTADELSGAKLDAKAYSRSASRINADGVGHPIDAVKLTEMFAERTKTDGATLVGRNNRDAKAFMEGLAAVQEFTGKAIDVPDSTVINKSGLTWGEAKKPKTDMRGANDPRAKLYEQGLGELSTEQLKAGIKSAEAALDGADPADPRTELQAEKLKRYSAELQKRTSPDPNVMEPDPFGPTFQDGKTLDQVTKGGINSDGGEVRDGARAPSLLGVPPDPKAVAAKKAALIEKAHSGDAALLDQLKTSTDPKGLQRAAQALEGGEDPNSLQAVETINKRLSELVADPDTAYGMLTRRYSLQQPGNTAKPGQLNDVLDYVNQVLGNSVKLDVAANIPHAAEFERVLQRGGVQDVIRISAHAMNPLSAAHHEAVHAFFAKLTDQQNGEVAGILERAASSPTVMLRLRELLKGQPEALRQLDDPEERAAYMYQFHSMGENLGLGQPAQTLFGRVAELVRSALGIWSNDQRALHVIDYFHSGEFKKNLADGDKVYSDLMSPGRNKAVEQLKAMAQPLTNLGEQLAVAGHQRLRDTGIPALREMADLVKRQGTEQGEDQGFIPAARQERAVRMNRLGEALAGVGPEGLTAAMEVLQDHTSQAVNAISSVDDRLAARGAVKTIRKALDEAFTYMTEAGVKVNDLGVGKDYFPRVWDVSYISSHKQEFLGMLDKYVKGGQFKGDPNALLQRLLTSEGNEFTIETDRPGMQFLKPRELAFIEGADATRFLNKNLYETLNSYMTQATRRAEWARRLGDEGQKFGELLTKAEQQGASAAQLDTARKYMRAVDGTLGDTISPEFRRLQGNVMVYQNLRLLPLAIFSSAVDAGGIAVRGGTVGEAFSAFKRGITEIPKGFKKDATHDEATQLAATLGTIDSAALVHTLGTSFSQGMVGETGRKLNDTFFRLNLMEQYNSSMRVAATQAAIGFLSRHADGAGTHSTRWLAELGMQPGEVQRGTDGRALVTEADGLTPEQAAKMKVAINRWVDGAVLRPDAADKPIWMSDPHFALISHLKQFTFSFQETILKRAAHELSHGNVGPAFALASYVPIMIAADAAKGLLQGAPQGEAEPEWKKSWEVSDYVQSGVERAGLLGVGQFGADMLKGVERGGSGVGALAGPTLEQLGDAVRVIGGRSEFSPFLLRSMPANALYANALRGEGAESRPTE
jgi:hypothetical protein